MKHDAYRTMLLTPGAMALAALVMNAASASANTIIGIIDWDPPPATAWQGTNSNVDVSIANDGDNWLSISFTNAMPPDMLVTGDAADLFAGTWRSESWIEFDFWADSTLPDTLQVRWGADGSSNVWAHAVTPSSGVGSWQTLRTASFGDGTDWTHIGLGDPNDFLADLSSTDWIGVYIDRAGAGDESYGVDDASLMVPEPAEILMLAAAFGVGLLVFRRMRLVPVAS